MVNRLCKRILLVNCKFVRRMPVLTWNVRNFYEKLLLNCRHFFFFFCCWFAVAIVLREWAGSFEPSVCTQTHAHCTRFELSIVYAISSKISISIILSLSLYLRLTFIRTRSMSRNSFSFHAIRTLCWWQWSKHFAHGARVVYVHRCRRHRHNHRSVIISSQSGTLYRKKEYQKWRVNFIFC